MIQSSQRAIIFRSVYLIVTIFFNNHKIDIVILFTFGVMKEVLHSLVYLWIDEISAHEFSPRKKA